VRDSDSVSSVRMLLRLRSACGGNTGATGAAHLVATGIARGASADTDGADGARTSALFVYALVNRGCAVRYVAVEVIPVASVRECACASAPMRSSAVAASLSSVKVTRAAARDGEYRECASGCSR
jgi:hypothetical protein